MHIQILLPKNIPLEIHREGVLAMIRGCFYFLESQSEGKSPHVHISLDASLEPPDTHMVMIVTARSDDNHREMSTAALNAAKAMSEHFKLKLEGHLVRSEKL